MLELIFKFIAGHMFADFVFQSEAMAVYKNRHMQHSDQRNFPKWYYWLSAHSFIHGAIVLMISANIYLALLETVLHFLIDFSKCEKWINFHVDQFLHILCKLCYTYYLLYMI